LGSFGVTIVFYDPYADNFSKNVTKLELEELLAISDIVTLHMPLTDKNYNLIGYDQIKIMKQSAYLVNLARGGLVDEVALLHALENRGIAGAAIDVYESEPYKGPLTNCNNIILTAHMGSYAAESRVLMEYEALGNLRESMHDRKLI
jgi:D-3-phosphoglycerate dehydrogenase